MHYKIYGNNQLKLGSTIGGIKFFKKEHSYCQTTYYGNKKIFIRNGGRSIQVDPIDALKQFRDRF